MSATQTVGAVRFGPSTGPRPGVREITQGQADEQRFRSALLKELRRLAVAVERVAASNERLVDVAAGQSEDVPAEPEPEPGAAVCTHPADSRLAMGMNGRGEPEWICADCQHHEGKDEA